MPILLLHSHLQPQKRAGKRILSIMPLDNVTLTGSIELMQPLFSPSRKGAPLRYSWHSIKSIPYYICMFTLKVSTMQTEPYNTANQPMPTNNLRS